MNYLLYHISFFVLDVNPFGSKLLFRLTGTQDSWYAPSLCVSYEFISLASFPYNLLNHWLYFLACISASGLKSFVHRDGVLIIFEGYNRRGLN